MGSKVFVSYKYKDSNVHPIGGNPNTIVRDYVNLVEDYFGQTRDVYKGEHDDEDLSELSDDTIWEKLKDRIYDSSVTIVMISPNMRQQYRTDKSQWLPWEVSYSLKEIERGDKTSHSNAMLAVVLPDRNGSYRYFIEETHCVGCSCICYKTDTLFRILGSNMFNKKQMQRVPCNLGKVMYETAILPSYIPIFKWDCFYDDIKNCIGTANFIKSRIDDYNVVKEI